MCNLSHQRASNEHKVLKTLIYEGISNMLCKKETQILSVATCINIFIMVAPNIINLYISNKFLIFIINMIFTIFLSICLFIMITVYKIKDFYMFDKDKLDGTDKLFPSTLQLKVGIILFLGYIKECIINTCFTYFKKEMINNAACAPSRISLYVHGINDNYISINILEQRVLEMCDKDVIKIEL